TASAAFDIDNTAPLIQWNSRPQQSFIGGMISLSVVATDNIKMKQVNYELVNSLDSNIKRAGSITQPNPQIPANVYEEKDFDIRALPAVSYVLKVYALDVAGNQSAVLQSNYTIDNNAPVIDPVTFNGTAATPATNQVVVKGNTNIQITAVDS